MSMLECYSDKLRDGHGEFLIDTGANVSVVACNSLKRDVKIVDSSMPVRACAGHTVPIVGHLLLDLKVNGFPWPTYAFWVADCTFGRYDGIIGTDILNDLSAVIDCGLKTLIVYR
jgi:hypothetical protein